MTLNKVTTRIPIIVGITIAIIDVISSIITIAISTAVDFALRGTSKGHVAFKAGRQPTARVTELLGLLHRPDGEHRGFAANPEISGLLAANRKCNLGPMLAHVMYVL